ncbi:DUF2262 domain-containing protein [Actinomadura violacea]|uniref:DUF2262 domain-containing protein n=1 Tax=Actinomadura violacea TaxID=2819934 RepID=A0ABS3S272_9ACTN|nr:DUF2262 domain-containing protein [Actinomadura violacea]MBO2463108.1 DUF2262 domain-containing protein [Actinomadura violacea]
MGDSATARTIELEDGTLGAVRGEHSGGRWSWRFSAGDVDFEDDGLADLPADVPEETVRERVAELAAITRRIAEAEPPLRRFAAERLLDAAYDWTHDAAAEGACGPEEVVNEPADIERRITLTSMSWNAVEGEGRLWYGDDMIFLNHIINVDFAFAADGTLVPKDANFQG